MSIHDAVLPAEGRPAASAGEGGVGAAAWTRWRADREAAVSRPHGVASLDRTAWLDETPRELDGLPGAWRVDGDVAEGVLSDEVVRIETGRDVEVEELRLRHFARHGGHALRVFDPASTNRTRLAGIDAYPYDPDWVVRGVFHPDDGAETADVTAVDGVVTATRLAGTIAVSTPAGAVELTVTRGADGSLFAVFADATNGDETYRFRFLDLEPEQGEAVTVDFNRAYLPPCAFSSEYVCPLPLPGNRWSVAVRAGERNPLYRS